MRRALSIIILFDVVGAHANKSALLISSLKPQWFNLCKFELLGQALIFVHKHPNSSNAYNKIIQSISQKNFVTVVDTKSIGKIPSVLFKRDTVTYVILCYDDSFFRLDETLWAVLMRNKAHARPRCLVIFIQDNSKLQNKNYRDIATKAWKWSFLDFSIVRIGSKEKPSIHHFNPFDSSYHIARLKKSSVIFPDKLKNVYRYKLKVFKNHEVRVDKHGNLKAWTYLLKPEIPVLSMVFKACNFTLSFMRSRVASDIVLIPYILIDLRGYPHLNFHQECVKIVAVHPILRINRLSSFYDLFVFAIFMFTVLIVSVVMKKLIKNSAVFWDPFNIITLLMGIAVNESPRTSTQFIAFLCLTMIAMMYSADLYSNLLEIKFVKQVKVFDTFKDMDDSQFPLYVAGSLKRFYLPNRVDNEDLYMNLVSKVGELDPNVCYKWAFYYKLNIFCITNEYFARAYCSKNCKIARPVFNCFFQGYMMHFGSPYHERFKRLIDLLREAGIVSYFEKFRQDNKYSRYSDDEEEFITVKVILSLLLAGYTLSIIVFIHEIFRDSSKS